MYEEDSFGVGDNGSDAGQGTEPTQTAEQESTDLAEQTVSESEAPTEESQALAVEQTEQAPDEAQTQEAVEPEAKVHDPNDYTISFGGVQLTPGFEAAQSYFIEDAELYIRDDSPPAVVDMHPDSWWGYIDGLEFSGDGKQSLMKNAAKYPTISVYEAADGFYWFDSTNQRKGPFRDSGTAFSDWLRNGGYDAAALVYQLLLPKPQNQAEQTEEASPEQLSYAEVLNLLTEREIEREQLRQQLDQKDRYYNELLEAAEGYIAEIKELQQPARLYHDRVEQLLRNLAPSSPDGEDDTREPAEIDQSHQVTSNALRHAIAVLGRLMSHFGSAGSLNFLPDHPVRKDSEYLLEWLTCPPIDKALAPEVRRRAAEA